MRSRIPIFVAAAIILGGCAPQVDVAAEEAAVRSISERWLEMSQQNDAAGIAALFAPDGNVYWEDQSPVSGPAAIEEFLTRDFAEAPGSEGGFAADRIDVAASGDLAVEHGAWTGSSGATGRYMTTYRNIDGAWRVVADMTVNTTPHGGAPDWAQADLARWYERYNARDAEGMGNLYAADARVGEVRGRAAIMRAFQDAWAEEDETCSGDYVNFVVVGPFAIGQGRDACTKTEDGSTVTEYSNWLVFYERQADGSWLMTRDYGEPVAS